MIEKKKDTKLVFVRHGESEKNVQRIKSSTLDKWPLTEKGREHAKNVANRLKEMGQFDILLSSPILRARQTAEIISNKLNLPIIYEELLKEYEYGRWNDLTKEELKKNGVEISDYADIKRTLTDLKREDKILFDPSKVSIDLYDSIAKEAQRINGKT
jgi:broad specificity phosphatase PhoE